MSSNNHDLLRLTQLVQDHHPALRRRAVTSIRTSFPSFFQSDIQINQISSNQSQKLISQHHIKIHHIIDLVDDHIRRRIQCYENQVVSVVQKQIQQMREQTEKVVEQFNCMIQQKNKENQIWSLNNQLDYFKSEAKKLFDQNKLLKMSNLQVKIKLKECQWQLQNRQVIMQKLLYKYQKEKFHKQKLKSKMNQKVQILRGQVSQKRRLPHPQVVQQSIEEDSFSMSELKVDSISLFKPRREQVLMVESHEDRKQQQNNSSLRIDYDQDGQSYKISLPSEIRNIATNNNINVNAVKPQLKDQQSQANIYLSQHSYKNLFGMKGRSKKETTQCKQTAMQTQKIHKGSEQLIQNQTKNSSPKKGREIDFTKNGFYVNQIVSNDHYRSVSSNFDSLRNQSPKQMRQKGRMERLTTQTSFNRHPNSEFVTTSPLANKNLTVKNKLYHRMMNKLQHSNIVGKAYSRQRFNTSITK